MVCGESSLVDGSNSPRLGILCLPARDAADEIAAMMLAQVLATKDVLVQAASATSLASEMVALVEQRRPDVVCLSATPPDAVMHARYLCRWLRDRFPEMNLVVGLWDFPGDVNKAQARIGCGAIAVATLADAQEHLRRLIPSTVPSNPGDLLAVAVNRQSATCLTPGKR